MAEATNGIQQMAVMMLNPQFAAQQQKFALQQAMAQQMMQEGSQQPPDNQLANPGGMVIKNSPLAALSRAVEKGVGAYAANKAIGDQMALAQQMKGNQGQQDPNAPTDEERLNGLVYGDKLATAGYQERTAGSKKRAESQNTLQNYNGHLQYPPAETAPIASPQSPIVNSGVVPVKAAPSPLPTATGENPSPMSPKGNGGPVDFNNPVAVKEAETASTKGAESGTAYQDKLIEESSHAIEGKRITEQMKQNVQGFEPGKLADAKANLGAWAQSMGMDKDAVNAQLGNVGDVQAFNKLTAQLAIQSIKQISPKATQMEFQRFLENNPNPELNPDAMKKLLDYTGKTFDIPLQKQQEWAKWKKGNNISNYSDFDAGFNQRLNENMPSTLSLHDPEAKGNVVKMPAASDIIYLKANPNVAADFDAEYGAGASQKYITPIQQGFK